MNIEPSYADLKEEMETNITKLREKVKVAAPEIKKLTDEQILKVIYIQLAPKLIESGGAIIQLSYCLKKFVIDPELV